MCGFVARTHIRRLKGWREGVRRGREGALGEPFTDSTLDRRARRRLAGCSSSALIAIAPLWIQTLSLAPATCFHRWVPTAPGTFITRAKKYCFYVRLRKQRVCSGFICNVFRLPSSLWVITLVICALFVYKRLFGWDGNFCTKFMIAWKMVNQSSKL